MSSIPWARALVAAVAAVTVVATLAVPGTSPTAAAPSELSPDQLVDAPGEIPCLDASPAEFWVLKCTAQVVQDFQVPSQYVSPLIASGAVPNCSAGPITEDSPTVTGRAVAAVPSRIVGLSSTDGGWIRHGGALTVDSDLGWVNLGDRSGPAAEALNQLPGWDSSMTHALGTRFATGETITRAVPGYHWGYYTYKPLTRQVDVMWSWKEPSLGSISAGQWSSAVMSTQFPMRSGGLFNIILADWILVTVPMTSVEVAQCVRGETPPEPTLKQPALRPPTEDTDLARFPVLYTNAPANYPVLSNRAGKSLRLLEPRLVTAMSASDGITYDDPLRSSMQLPGGAEVGYWNDGSCSIFSARVGYGENLLVAAEGYARDDFEVWAGSVVEGKLQVDRLLLAALVPAPPDLAEVVGREHFQSDIRVAIPDDTEVVVLKVTTRSGYRDLSSVRTPGVIVAEPALRDCEHPSGWTNYLSREPSDPVAAPSGPLPTDTLLISGMEWVRSTNYWGPAERDSSLGEDAAGDGQPLSIGGVRGWGSGIGVAPSVGAAESQIDLRTSGRCDRVTAWVGIDDEVGRNGTVRFAVYADGQLVTRSGIKRGGDQPTFLSADVAGALVVTLGVDNAGDGNAYDHADWAEPKLRCEVGGGHPNDVAVANATWSNQLNFWGPIEKNMSLGEDAPQDGGPMSIGSSSGWATGIAMAPGGAYDQKAFVELDTTGCDRFTAWVGIDDEVGSEGTVMFSVFADDVLVMHSPVLRGGVSPWFLRADLGGARMVRLQVDNGGDDNRYDHANWADPTLYCG